MKLWEKGIPTDKQIEQFTVGNDRELDLVLAKYDALGSIAQAKMLHHIGLLSEEETSTLVLALEDIIVDINHGEFEIEESFEDVHSKIEYSQKFAFHHQCIDLIFHNLMLKCFL